MSWMVVEMVDPSIVHFLKGAFGAILLITFGSNPAVIGFSFLVLLYPFIKQLKEPEIVKFRLKEGHVEQLRCEPIITNDDPPSRVVQAIHTTTEQAVSSVHSTNGVVEQSPENARNDRVLIFEAHRKSMRAALVVPGVLNFSTFDMRRQNLAEKSLSALKLRITSEYGNDPYILSFLSDLSCYRFLRAREGNVEAAMQMIRATVAWRKKHNLFHQKARCVVCEQQDPKSHAYFCIGFDILDRAVMYSCSARAIEQKDAEAGVFHMVAEMEHFLDDSKGVAQIVWVVDFNGFKARHANPELGSLAAAVFQQVYPERLGQLVLLDFPWIFALFFKIVSPLLDPVTRGKIVVLRSRQEQQKYFQENWHPEMVDWINQVIEMPPTPGLFPDSAIKSRHWH